MNTKRLQEFENAAQLVDTIHEKFKDDIFTQKIFHIVCLTGMNDDNRKLFFCHLNRVTGLLRDKPEAYSCMLDMMGHIVEQTFTTSSVG